MTSEDHTYLDRLVDVDAIVSYFEDRLGSVETVSIEHHKEGHSNETLFVTWGDRDFVIRRPPPGEIAEKAHDVLREYRVLSALQQTDVPVPRTVFACDDHSVIGSDFYVMEREEGDVLRDAEAERFADPPHRRELGEELVDGLARVHEVDYEAAGLGDLGYPDGFTERQVDRWRQQLEWAFERTEDERSVPLLSDVGDWLEANLPGTYPHTLVHGDYKLDNVMFAPGTPPRLVSIFDWELTTLGDPRTDVGWMLIFWHEADDAPPAVPELEATFMQREGYPSRAALVERYERQSGIQFEFERFYRTLAVYKLAALGEMFYRRYLEGNSDDPLYPVMEDRVPALAERAQRIIEGEEPL